jgi:hypothetical protein
MHQVAGRSRPWSKRPDGRLAILLQGQLLCDNEDGPEGKSRPMEILPFMDRVAQSETKSERLSP